MAQQKETPLLHTARLTLRGITADDAAQLVAWRADPAVYRWFTAPHQVTLDEHNAWFETRYQQDLDRLDFVARESGGAPVGVFGVKRQGAAQAEISYLTDPAWQGRGYAAEAVEALVAWAGQVWQITRLVAVVHPDNTPSIRLARHCGFVPAGVEGRFEVYEKRL